MHFKACQNDCESGSTCLEDHVIFSPHSPSSIWSGCDCHSPVRSFAHSELTQHLFSCLFNPIYASAWLRWKGGKWWKLSCLFTWNSFHSCAKRVQAPNDTNSEMKAANLTVRHWIVVSGCSLPAGVSQLEEPMCEKLLGFLSRWGWGGKKASDLWFIITTLNNQGAFCEFCW